MFIWLSIILAVQLTPNVHGTNLAHTVFLPSTRSLNPFSDSFTQQVANMNRKQLSAFPVLNDEEFLHKFILNGKSSRSLSISSNVTDPYASILDDKIDDQLAAQDVIDSEWVYLMTSGPLAINYISHLLVVASRRNFPLIRPQNFSFQYIKYPDSFQATLAQISGGMYSALLGAHTTMDRIQLNVKQIPNHIKTTLTSMLSGSPKLINILLPKSLESIGRIANESALYARETYEKFNSLQNLIGEVIEVSTYTQSKKKILLEQIKNETLKAKLDEKSFNDNINIIKSQYAIAQQEMEKARQEYRDAEKAIPAKRFLKRLSRAICRAVVRIITLPIRILGCILGLCFSDHAAYETAKQNAIAKAKLLLQVLHQAEDRYRAFAAQQTAEQQKLMIVTHKLATLDFNRMNEEDIIDILHESLLQMNQLKVEWRKLIQFFSKLSIQADSIQQIVVHEALGVVELAVKDNLLLDPIDREFFVETLSMTLQEVERIAHLLFIMSKTYYDVSSEYMINQMERMNVLLMLQTNDEQLSHLRALNSTIKTTSENIIQLGQQRHNEYSLRNKARRQEFQDFLAKVTEE